MTCNKEMIMAAADEIKQQSDTPYMQNVASGCILIRLSCVQHISFFLTEALEPFTLTLKSKTQTKVSTGSGGSKHSAGSLHFILCLFK